MRNQGLGDDAAALPESGDAGTRAGVTAILAALGASTGLLLGGPLAAGAGVLLVGAGANGLRAHRFWGSEDPAEKREAGISANFALLEVAFGGYLAYKAFTAKKERS